MRDLPLPLALTARLLPVALLAGGGWAMTSGPFADGATGQDAAQRPETASATASASPSAPSASAATRTFPTAPDPCAALAKKTVTALVPGAEAAGEEIPSTDESVRRTCSWNALEDYDYRWLDVSYEIRKSDADAGTAYAERTGEKDGGGAVPGLGDEAYSVVNLGTADGQQTREGVVIVRASNALVLVTYNGSDFESKKAPSADTVNKGAIAAAKEAVAALDDAR
ncbi:hypothetical protein [Streptomyces sp. CRN 30]|uniref:hypothetical protein n=1 Tax=Streptomyces sp. CRN 30 TaxID=3075613 RepID=UPI002A810D3D|nr:hypothetical protein [Streptomyces sp. CRN 30]